jgi:hypothetical protein
MLAREELKLMIVIKNSRQSPKVLALVVCSMFANASPAYSQDPPPPFPIANKFSRGLQRYTGINYVTEVISSQIASSVVSHKLGSAAKAKVQVKTYSFTDLIAGKVRLVTVRLTPASCKKGTQEVAADNSKNQAPGQIKSQALSNPEPQKLTQGCILATTQHPVWFNYRNKKKPKGVLSPVLVAIDGQLSEDDLANAVANPEVASRLKLLKIDLPGMGSQQIQVLSPQVSLQGNRVRLEGKLCAANADPKSAVQVCFIGEPALEGDYRILIKNVQVDSNTIDSPYSFAQFAQQLMNPLVDFRRMDRHNRAIRMQNLQVADSRVKFNAKLLLAPKPAAQLAKKH